MTSIKASEFYIRLGTGIDVDWCKTNNARRQYNRCKDLGVSIPQAFSMRGFDHARIRCADYDLDTVFDATGFNLLTEIKRCVTDCNAFNLTPIVAFQAEDWKLSPGGIQTDRVIEWWQVLATELIGMDCAFNLLIETTEIGTAHAAELNALYRQCAAAITAIDTDRVMIITPDKISAPERLTMLEIPDGHVFLESHFYAAGPSPTSKEKKWTTGTEAEKQLIRNKVKAIVDYRTATGNPVWVGAIMFGNYNSDGIDDLLCSYTIDEQCTIARFILGELRSADIPVAINADNKYYDDVEGHWIESMDSLVDAFFEVA